MKELLDILSEVCPTVDFENEKNLIDDELIDSFELVAIVSVLMEHYGIELDADDLLPENFNSAETILELVEKRRG